MEPVPLPNEILCSGFTYVLSAILNQNIKEFAIMTFFFQQKKYASYFLMFICQICVEKF